MHGVVIVISSASSGFSFWVLMFYCQMLPIDEIDAIGKRRGMAGDAGASEREAGLMQLLVEMDGIVRQDQVVVIGATNRISLLDPALLRPGRFDRIVYMGRPSESNRLKILKVSTGYWEIVLHVQYNVIGEELQKYS